MTHKCKVLQNCATQHSAQTMTHNDHGHACRDYVAMTHNDPQAPAKKAIGQVGEGVGPSAKGQRKRSVHEQFFIF
jgi:hypothetical protein